MNREDYYKRFDKMTYGESFDLAEKEYQDKLDKGSDWDYEEE